MNNEYELLTASASIIIEVPLEEVWKKLTQPGVEYQWISDDDSEDSDTIFSNWKINSPITWQYYDSETKKFEDYYRGTITKIDNNRLISFDIHDALDEDMAEEFDDDQPDIHEETWELTFEQISENKTKLTLSKSDYDCDHISDDEHDHGQAIEIWEESTKHGIPNQLGKIKKFCEQK